MKRPVAVVAAIAVALSACGVPDRYLPKLVRGETVALVAGVTAMTIGPGNATYYATASGDVYSLAKKPAELIAHFPTTRLDSIIFSPHGVLYGAFLTARGVVVAVWKNGVAQSVIETASKTRGDVVFDGDGKLLLAVGDRIVDGQGEVISSGWTSPRIVAGRGNRIWVIDDAPGGKELAARGREKNGAKRRRFASVLPARTDPSDVAILKNELLVCSRHFGTVYRLHIGLDEVARRRDPLKGVRCRNAIVVSPDNSVFTATDDAILRYGAR